MIRKMVKEDIPDLLYLGAMFYREAKLDELAPFNAGSVGVYLEHVIPSGDSVVFVAEQDGKIIGAIGGTVSPWLYNFDVKMCLENFWYFDPAARNTSDALRLLKTLRAWAQDMGAEVMAFGAFKHLQHDRLAGIYKKLGYEHGESLFFGRV